MEKTNGTSGDAAILQEILASLKTIQQENTHLAAAVDAINGRVNILAGVKQVKDMTVDPTAVEHNKQPPADPVAPALTENTPSSPDLSAMSGSGRRSSVTSKIILTSYPGQAGVDPLPMDWGNKDPSLRGPVVVSRNPSSIRRRNAIGAHGGSYAICMYTNPFPIFLKSVLSLVYEFCQSCGHVSLVNLTVARRGRPDNDIWRVLVGAKNMASTSMA
jgi:hypothetical protein